MDDADALLKLFVLSELVKRSNSSDTSELKSVLLDVGLKVVRGPDWKWDNQDDGEGHIGTVVEVGKPGTSTDKTVVVQWDCGTRRNYRVGYSGCYDLRTLDNASVGVKHPTVDCNSCRKSGVLGMRWKCKVCFDYDLCTQCYMSDKHDITHAFSRIQINRATGVDVPKRENSVKIPMKGILPSAKVVRGHDWKWGNQDGGSNKTGIVTTVKGWGDDYEFNACYVWWPANESKNFYRIGADGKVDLKYVVDAADGFYYRDHLPILGDESRAVPSQSYEPTKIPDFSDRRGSESMNKSRDNSINEIGSYTGSTLLSQNMKDLFFSDQFCDLTLKVKDRQFKVHKAIICARSSAFSAKVQSMRSTSGTLEIKDCEPDTFEDVLFYLYTGKLKRLSHGNVNDLFKVADTFEITALRDECLRFKTDGLSSEYISDFIAFA